MNIKIINDTNDGIPGDLENAILNQYTAAAINEACEAYDLKISEIELIEDCKTYVITEKRGKHEVHHGR